jgi:23S rRNA pseudouridine1911/1915/1917 synthase
MALPPDPDEDGLAVVLGPSPPARLDKALLRDLPEGADLSRSRLARLIAEGAVSREGQPVTDAAARVAEGETYRILVTAPEAPEALPEAIPLSVVFEDADLLVVDKPAGMVVHPAPGAATGTLVNALLHHCGEGLRAVGGLGRPGLVHRIDKDTTGLLVVAKTVRAHAGLSAQFAAHTTTRHYAALVHGVPDPADPRLRGVPGAVWEPGAILRIATLLDRHPSDRQRQAVTQGRGRPAVTRARTVDRFGMPPALARLDCWLETGRTHQVRVHMAHAGHALVGDPVYGGHRRASARALGADAAAAVDAFPRQALHAATLGFVHPVTGAALSFAAPLPEDMARLLSVLPASG